MKSDYERIAAAIWFIERSAPDQPTLADIASELGLSTFHFQRLFQRWAGVSPKRFLQFLTVQHAKQLLGTVQKRAGHNIRSGAIGSGASPRPLRLAGGGHAWRVQNTRRWAPDWLWDSTKPFRLNVSGHHPTGCLLAFLPCR